jgi:hypothetical protein
MNRRTLLRTAVVSGTGILAGCSVFDNSGRNDAITTAHSELSEATAILNDVELTTDGELDVSSRDFEGYSLEDVTSRTETANEALSHDDSDVSDVLSVVSTVLEETAYQYTAIDSLFVNFAAYEQRLYDNDYQNAIRAANRLGDAHAEVTDRGDMITDYLNSLENAGYESPVDGFSVKEWSQEQSRFTDFVDTVKPLRYGFNEQARGLLRFQRVSADKDEGAYENGLEEARHARNWFEAAQESFHISLSRGITYRRALIEDYLCFSEGLSGAIETATNSLNAYNSGNKRKGDDLWQQMKEEIQKADKSCRS